MLVGIDNRLVEERCEVASRSYAVNGEKTALRVPEAREWSVCVNLIDGIVVMPSLAIVSPLQRRRWPVYKPARRRAIRTARRRVRSGKREIEESIYCLKNAKLGLQALQTVDDNAAPLTVET